MVPYNSSLYYYDNKEKIFTFFSYWKNYTQFNQSFLFFFSNNLQIFNSQLNSSISTSLISDYFEKNNDNNYLFDFFKKENLNQLVNNFIPIRSHSIISFFINNMVDVPICFKKSFSSKTKNFELPLLKFTNLLMRKGKREKITKVLTNSFFATLMNLKKEDIGKMRDISWFKLFFYFNSSFLIQSKILFSKLNTGIKLSVDSWMTEEGKFINEYRLIKNHLTSLLTQFTPTFSFFIYNVDKNLKKFSRGKSGKYAFVWKYIAPYKRLIIAMRWIIKDIKFNNNRKFEQRLIYAFNKLIKEPKTSFAHKSYVFAHNYAFKNLRRTLMTTMRTTI